MYIRLLLRQYLCNSLFFFCSAVRERILDYDIPLIGKHHRQYISVARVSEVAYGSSGEVLVCTRCFCDVVANNG